MAAQIRHENLLALFDFHACQKAHLPFLFYKSASGWASINWGETRLKVAALAEAMAGLGFEAGDRVILLSENRPEWCIADLAIMAAGCITVPAYTSNTPADHAHILDNSDARAVIVSGQKLLKNLLPALQMAGSVEHVIAIDDTPLSQATGFGFHQWQTLMMDYAGKTKIYEAALDRLTRNDMACIIYTSGTGGKPRGVMQSHGAIMQNVEGASLVVYEDFEASEQETFLSFLPLSHAYEHTGGQYLPISMGAQIYYAEGLDKLARNIEEVRPSIMVVVPRLFEVLRARIIKNVEKQGGLAVKLLSLAQNLAQRQAKGARAFYDKPLDLLLEKLFRPKIRAKFGGRMKAMVSGGAPLNPEIGYFFQAVGLTLLQGYGQTESGPIISCNRPSAGLKMETVGPPLKDVELKIAEDGEICVRGELVMLGYWRNQKETDKVLINGWLHTGDIGHLDAQGRLVITDRKKDLIVNDKGDNVAPQRIEGMLTLEPEIGQAMVQGDKRPYIVAIITPDAEWTAEWAAAQATAPNMAELLQDSAYNAAIRAAVDRVNRNLSVIEKVRRICFSDEPFSIENSEMTPSLKIRRHKISERYQDRLDALYKN